MQFTAATAAAILAFCSTASAHMKLANPAAYVGSNANNSPLEPDGSNFPCKGGPFTATTPNSWEAGSTQTISFMGSAVHAGGSCQFSFTTDKEPTKNSVWKVIHSVIGGCPANAEGNLVIPGAPSGSAENTGNGLGSFPITIPKDVPNGDLSFAWTWFNKMGNREMYMNCAPVTITGGSDSMDAFNKLPNMFTANIGNGCTTQENFDIMFPNPGEFVTKAGNPGSIGAPGFTGTCDAASGPAAPPSSPSPPSNPGNDGPAPVTPPPSNSPPKDPAPVTPPPSTGGSTCTANGAIVCISATQFGICNNGVAIPQDVAAGTTCQNGAIVRRAVRHPRRHGSSMVRRHGSAFKA